MIDKGIKVQAMRPDKRRWKRNVLVIVWAHCCWFDRTSTGRGLFFVADIYRDMERLLFARYLLVCNIYCMYVSIWCIGRSNLIFFSIKYIWLKHDVTFVYIIALVKFAKKRRCSLTPWNDFLVYMWSDVSCLQTITAVLIFLHLMIVFSLRKNILIRYKELNNMTLVFC